jgi:hypothetical protein
MKRQFIIFVFLLFTISTGSRVSAQAKQINVLFVGNSLTYTNNLPEIISYLFANEKISLTYKTFTFSDYSLEDHWNDGMVEAEITTGKYDYVVLQQGPSALDESRVLLIEYVKKFAALCKDTKTKPLLYMVWPSQSRLFDLERVIKNYTDAARISNSVLCPAGLAWKYTWDDDKELLLYSADGLHPTLQGSLLAALTIYAGIKGIKKLEAGLLPPAGFFGDLPAPTKNILIKAVNKSLKQE